MDNYKLQTKHRGQ